MNSLAKTFPLIIVILAAIYLILAMIPPRSEPGQMLVHQFARIPLVADGRVKPFESYARQVLLTVSNRSTWEDGEGRKRPPIEFLLGVMARKPEMAHAPVFRIEHPQVLDVLGLAERPGLRYALAEFVEKVPELGRQASRASRLSPRDRDIVDRKILETAHRLSTFDSLWWGRDPLVVPPQHDGEEWKPLLTALMELNETKRFTPAAQALTMSFASYQSGNTESFNRVVNDYRREFALAMPDEARRAGFEWFFANAQPFYHGAVLYLLAAILGILAWLGFSRPLNRAALGLVLLAFLIHTLALIARMYLQGRPPVTNLMASAVFVGWGAVIVGVFLEWIYRLGLGTLVAAVTGFLALVVAINLASDGKDSLEMLQAVLDTNFWLATHVTTITLGYSAVFVAGLLAIVYVLLGLFTTRLAGDEHKKLARMIYGVICFATFLSFTGTVLGGIWADQSWGRFWGWDPKENGALLIVLWCALILHARWGGMIQQRGLAVMAIFGNVVTTWAWFGVNELGVGLHSYGFTDGTRFWLLTFVLSQLALMAFGLLPRRYWRSFDPNLNLRAATQSPAAEPAPAA